MFFSLWLSLPVCQYFLKTVLQLFLTMFFKAWGPLHSCGHLELLTWGLRWIWSHFKVFTSLPPNITHTYPTCPSCWPFSLGSAARRRKRGLWENSFPRKAEKTLPEWSSLSTLGVEKTWKGCNGEWIGWEVLMKTRKGVLWGSVIGGYWWCFWFFKA